MAASRNACTVTKWFSSLGAILKKKNKKLPQICDLYVLSQISRLDNTIKAHPPSFTSASLTFKSSWRHLSGLTDTYWGFPPDQYFWWKNILANLRRKGRTRETVMKKYKNTLVVNSSCWTKTIIQQSLVVFNNALSCMEDKLWINHN